MFSSGVVVLSVVWLAIAIGGNLRRSPADREIVSERLSVVPGIALVLAVVLFIALRPLIGLVLMCALAGLSASVGARERSVVGLALSALVTGAIAFAIAALLLPAATPLWPWSPHL